uniref:PE family protein n=1 Tax=Strongyloides papillosus TaxID=174720 RepID=A0A0N5BIP3_STREA
MVQQLAPQFAADLSAILALNLYFQHKFAGNGNNGGDDDAGAANASRVATDAVSVGHTATASVAGYGYVNRSS